MTAAITAFYGFDGEMRERNIKFVALKFRHVNIGVLLLWMAFITVDGTEDSGTGAQPNEREKSKLNFSHH